MPGASKFTSQIFTRSTDLWLGLGENSYLARNMLTMRCREPPPVNIGTTIHWTQRRDDGFMCEEVQETEHFS